MHSMEKKICENEKWWYELGHDDRTVRRQLIK